jgi:hypothetical protein
MFFLGSGESTLCRFSGRGLESGDTTYSLELPVCVDLPAVQLEIPWSGDRLRWSVKFMTTSSLSAGEFDSLSYESGSDGTT